MADLEELARAVAEARQEHEEAGAAVDALEPEWGRAVERRRRAGNALRYAQLCVEDEQRRRAVAAALEELRPGCAVALYLGERDPRFPAMRQPRFLVAVGPENEALYEERWGARRGRTWYVVRGGREPERWERRDSYYGRTLGPAPPPSGGKWRWLKIKEQAQLVAPS